MGPTPTPTRLRRSSHPRSLPPTIALGMRWAPIMDRINVTMQELRETARRRVLEARLLLTAKEPQRKDGAVTCALLSAECALKALVLFGHRLNSIEETHAPENEDLKLKQCFHGAAGHKLQNLVERLPAEIKALRLEEEFEAITTLNRCDRYTYRYGAQGTGIRPKDASPLIEHAETLIKWMNGVME